MFAKGIPTCIIKVCVASGNVESATVRCAREKGKPGRKRSAAMKITLGKYVERYE